ncbi:MAG TPA: PRC-barrel domain-containing protein [Xanthobacteraceae bacterium]|jgi:hypothetical protein|nr:PRC-barrel domain-containing protein [Xanthobacteraceae bacterium]
MYRHKPKFPAAIEVTAALLVALLVALGATVGIASAEDSKTSAQPPAATETSPAPAPSPPASVTILNDHEVEGILGREVVSSAGEDMGRIVDVLVDRHGQVRAAIIDFGGFLGVGSRKIAVDWNALHFPPPVKSDAKITLDLTRDQVKAAPEFQEGKPVVVLGALGKLEPLPAD